MTKPLPPAANLPSSGRLLAEIAAAFVAASVIVVLVVLPAEYGIDPTGFGRAVGLDRLRMPAEVVVETRSEAPAEIERVYAVPYRSDEIVLEVQGNGRGVFTEVEYKVTMEPGQTLVYSWTADADVYFDFHGHAARTPETLPGPVQVMNYRSGTARQMSGSLVAPMSGIHGWYFRRAGGASPFVVRIKLSGFYELTPGRLDVGGPFAQTR